MASPGSLGEACQIFSGSGLFGKLVDKSTPQLIAQRWQQLLDNSNL